MKKILLFSLMVMLFCISFSWAEEKGEKEIAINQINERFAKYMTAIKYQDWEEAYKYISSRTYKYNFVENMKAFWDESYNPNAPKYLGFYIDSIKFNDFLDEAEVWFTEKRNFKESRSDKTSWRESEFPQIYIWVKESDGQWYRDYGNPKQRIE